MLCWSLIIHRRRIFCDTCIPLRTPWGPFCHGNGCKILGSSTEQWSDVGKVLAKQTEYKWKLSKRELRGYGVYTQRWSVKYPPSHQGTGHSRSAQNEYVHFPLKKIKSLEWQKWQTLYKCWDLFTGYLEGLFAWTGIKSSSGLHRVPNGGFPLKGK